MKGNSGSSADHGWATSNNSNWLLSRRNFVTNNKNSAAYGTNPRTKGLSNSYLHEGRPFNSGEVWGQSEGPEGFTYSNLNGNNFGYGI